MLYRTAVPRVSGNTYSTEIDLMNSSRSSCQEERLSVCFRSPALIKLITEKHFLLWPITLQTPVGKISFIINLARTLSF